MLQKRSPKMPKPSLLTQSIPGGPETLPEDAEAIDDDPVHAVPEALPEDAEATEVDPVPIGPELSELPTFLRNIPYCSAILSRDALSIP